MCGCVVCTILLCVERGSRLMLASMYEHVHRYHTYNATGGSELLQVLVTKRESSSLCELCDHGVGDSHFLPVGTGIGGRNKIRGTRRNRYYCCTSCPRDLHTCNGRLLPRTYFFFQSHSWCVVFCYFLLLVVRILRATRQLVLALFGLFRDDAHRSCQGLTHDSLTP